MTWQMWLGILGFLILFIFQAYQWGWLTSDRLRDLAILLLRTYLSKTRPDLLEDLDKEEDDELPPPMTSVCSRAAPFSVYFSPGGGCETALIAQIQRAAESIYIMAYYLTDANIIEELTKAAQRGVVVQFVCDDVGDNSPAIKGLRDAGAKHWIDKKHAIMHNKVMVVDQSVLVTGSFNFTKSADERNAENLLIIRHPDLAKKYLDNWRLHQWHSDPYKE